MEINDINLNCIIKYFEKDFDLAINLSYNLNFKYQNQILINFFEIINYYLKNH